MISSVLEKLTRRQDLTTDEASAGMTEIIEGRATSAQIAGFLVGLAMKGEQPAEIVGLAKIMRTHAIKLPLSFENVVDTCGTGGDRSGTFNISSATALVIAGTGQIVAKHGNRSVSSACGSADVFEALGVATTLSPQAVATCLAEIGFAFLFAPAFHPSMRHAAPTRRELGLRTAFNLLGPLTNPAMPQRQIVGVPRPELTELLARALLELGSARAWVVHGADGIDEISTTGYTKVSECYQGAVKTFYVHPADCGLPKVSLDALKGCNPTDNASIIRSVLDGIPGPARDVVLLNAGAALFVAERVESVQAGVGMAREAIDSGQARAVLARLIELTGHLAARDANQGAA